MKKLLAGFTLLLLAASASAQTCQSVSPYTNKVCHIVFLIQENVSFDHYFGCLSTVIAGVDGLPNCGTTPTAPTMTASSVSASMSGATATFTLASGSFPAGFTSGSTVVATGFSVSGYNVTWTLSGAGGGSSITATATGVSGLASATGGTLTPPMLHAAPQLSWDDPLHVHSTSATDIDSGAMDGFTTSLSSNCGTAGAPGASQTAYCPILTYLLPSDIPTYTQLAQTYLIADHHFSTISGWSDPSHLFLYTAQGVVGNTIGDTISNQGGNACDNCSINPIAPNGEWRMCNAFTVNSTNYLGGSITPQACSSPPCLYSTGSAPTSSTLIQEPINSSGATYNVGVCQGTPLQRCTGVGTGTCPGAQSCFQGLALGGGVDAPCPNVTSLGYLLTQASITWAWYGPGMGDRGAHWEAPYYVQNDYFGSILTTNVKLTNQFCQDVASGNLPSVSWISPPKVLSDHPSFYGDQQQTANSAMAYVAGMLNCLAQSPTYSTTLG